MQRIFYILLLLNTLHFVKAQNLVPNPGFENYFFCPTSIGQVDTSCKNWFTPMAMHKHPTHLYKKGSSDYFNACGQHFSCQVPQNYWGNQYAQNGKAFVGIVLFESKLSRTLMEFPYKEYIEVEINQSLENTNYCIEFHYSIAEHEYWNYITTKKFTYIENVKIQALLSDTLIHRKIDSNSVGALKPLNICATPNFETSLVPYKDTVNWIHIKGHFKAKGGERYLTIGNFECNPTDYNPDSVAIYIYIDNVKLYKCDPDSVNNKPVDSLIIPNVFTPNADGYNDKFEFKNQEQWEFETQIFNRWGDLVFDNKSSENWDGTYQGQKVSTGVYFFIIKAQAIRTGEERVYKGHVTVMY
jgi:gliding motility-associated-like protein